MDFILEISVKKPLRKDSLYIWGKFFVGLCYTFNQQRFSEGFPQAVLLTVICFK